jgi:hypothetical protein
VLYYKMVYQCTSPKATNPAAQANTLDLLVTIEQLQVAFRCGCVAPADCIAVVCV